MKNNIKKNKKKLILLLAIGLLLMNGLGLKHPKDNRSPVDVEIYLSKDEKEIVRKTYLSKCMSDE